MTIQRGYGITPIAFDAGHVLALRVFLEPEPRVQVWHRTPEAPGWTVYEGDGVAARWPGGPSVRVSVEETGLVWHVRLRSSPLARLANAHPSRVALEMDGPAHAGRVRLRVRGGPDASGTRGTERARAEGSGPASGREESSRPWSAGRTVVRPRRVFVVGSARATLDGRDLGAPGFAAPGSLGGLLPWRAPGLLVEGEMRVQAEGGAAASVAGRGWASEPWRSGRAPAPASVMGPT